MPTFINPKWVHVAPGSRGPLGSVVPLAVTAGIVGVIVKVLTSHAVEHAIDVAVYVILGVVIVACVGMAWLFVHVVRKDVRDMRPPLQRSRADVLAERAVEPVERPAVAAVRSPAAVAPVRRAAITGRRIVAGELIARSEKVEHD